MTSFDALWDFNDPASTEQKFLELWLSFSNQPNEQAELLTQIARTRGLQRRFEEAHATLNEALKLLELGSRAQVRYFLERGRVYRSSNEIELAKPCFEQAFQLGSNLGEDTLTVDAAHMLALVESGEMALEWSVRALELARTSHDEKARAWKASLLNNIGWNLLTLGRFEEALEHFQETVNVHEGNPTKQRIARWSVARVLRSSNKPQQALELQYELLRLLETQEEADGYVHEEIAENLLMLDMPTEAATHFERAFELLSSDSGLQKSEPARLVRLERLSHRNNSTY